MIIALFALALAMIIGGIASVVQGFPFVRLESGLAMVIAGATTASAGAVLLGIAVLARQIRDLARRPAVGAGTIAVPPTPEVPVPPAGMAEADGGEPAREAVRRPLLAGAGGLLAGSTGAAYLGGALRERPEPSFEPQVDDEPPASIFPAPPESRFPALQGTDLAHPRDLEPHLDRPPAEDVPEPPSSLVHEPAAPAAEPAFHAEPVGARDLETDAELFALPEPEARDGKTAPASSDDVSSDALHSEEPALRPALDDPPVPTEAPAARDLEVVGTYVSGGNTYVMFSDGSIEADTPRGRFTFESLDELKAFVEAGGEGETHGVA